MFSNQQTSLWTFVYDFLWQFRCHQSINVVLEIRASFHETVVSTTSHTSYWFTCIDINTHFNRNLDLRRFREMSNIVWRTRTCCYRISTKQMRSFIWDRILLLLWFDLYWREMTSAHDTERVWDRYLQFEHVKHKGFNRNV